MTTHKQRRSKDTFSRRGGTEVADEVLLERAARGDREAFAHFYDRHAAAVYGLACQEAANPADAGLTTEEVFSGARRAAEGFDPTRSSARVWLLAATHRRAVDTDRQRSDAPGDGSRAPERQWAHESASAGLPTLTKEEQMTIQLACLGGLTCAQIAAVLDVGVPTVEQRILTGLRALATGGRRAG